MAGRSVAYSRMCRALNVIRRSIAGCIAYRNVISWQLTYTPAESHKVQSLEAVSCSPTGPRRVEDPAVFNSPLPQLSVL